MRKVISFLKWTLFSIAALFGVLVIWVSIWLDSGQSATSTPKKSQDEMNRITAGVACQSAIKANLKDPSSAQFVDRLNWPSTLKDGIWTVEATYRGTNGFGGVVTETITCKAADGSFSAVLIR